MIRSIFSTDQRGGIGNKGTLPWAHDADDLTWFRQATTDHVVVMGRKTWQDPKFPKPLPNRTCVVLSSQKYIAHAHVMRGDLATIMHDLKEIYKNKHIWIIGGADLLTNTKDYCDQMWIAHRRGVYTTDTRIDMQQYLTNTRITSSGPNSSRSINWCIYKNIDIFRPL